MNLIIDVGNSFVKIAVYEFKTLIFKGVFKNIDVLNQLQSITIDFPDIKSAICSSVGCLSDSVLSYLKENYELFFLSHNLNIPFVNKYKTPHSLGVDRIALAAAATVEYPGKNVLVIDAGTCVTYDFKNFHEEYLGGAISPGLAMRYKSLNYFTEKLPSLKLTKTENLIGNDTESSIHSGVINGMVSEIDGVIDLYKVKFDDLTIVLTGGDAEFLSLRLKNSIFANSNFLLDGLNHLLEFNLNE